MSIKLGFPDKKTKTYPKGIKAKELAGEFSDADPDNPLVALRFNNDIVSLSSPLLVNASVEPVYLDSEAGTHIYRRSLCFLLALVSKQLFPHKRLVISHSLGPGFYYYFEGTNGLEESDLQCLAAAITTMAEQDDAIELDQISYSDAIRFFKKNNLPDTLLLIKYQNNPIVPVYRCNNYMDLAHMALLYRTGLIKHFEIRKYQSGFLLRFPDFGNQKIIPEFQDYPILFSVYREYKSWGKILKMNSIGSFNDLIFKGKIKEFIQVAEALHEKKISQIADMICAEKENIKLILIAGPSSSGKTTFSKKLAIELRVLGRNPVVISGDDYFVERERTPHDEEGNLDFEAIEAIDIDLLNSHLVALFENREIELPGFNFVSGKREFKGNKLKLPQRSVLILEGIHCLNDKLTPKIGRSSKFKIYVSALTQLNLDDHNRIPTTDNRLLRRIVRDHKFRGHSVIQTLKMWPSVRRGENKNIFPYQNSADIAFNSALDYELAVLKVYAEPLLKTVNPDYFEYYETSRLLSFLSNILPIPTNWVPEQSILREFIGDSYFSY